MKAIRHAVDYLKFRSVLFAFCFLPCIALTADTDQQLVNLTGEDFHSGETVSLSDYEGHIVYLDFWASWCAPCREILPRLEVLSKKYASEKITFIAVNIDEHKADAERFIQSFPISYPHLYDPKGHLAKPFNVRNMPTGVLFDNTGQVHLKHVGFQNGDIEKLEQLVLELYENG